jgi:hypothetical protein
MYGVQVPRENDIQNLVNKITGMLIEKSKSVPRIYRRKCG